MKSFLSGIALCMLTLSLSAQNEPLVDISLVDDGNGSLEVLVRPDGPFDEVFSSLVFTIRWNTSDAVNLGTISQTIPELIYMPIVKSGGEQDNTGYRYQIFAGFGTQQLAAFGAAWVGGQEVSLMTIPVSGASTFEIVNDAWTGAVSNNGDYYVSLNGLDRTGIIYGGAISTGVDDGYTAGANYVVPNPSSGAVSLRLADIGTGGVEVELVNPMGQVVWQSVENNVANTLQLDVDLSGYGSGSYFFRVLSTGGLQTIPFVLQ